MQEHQAEPKDLIVPLTVIEHVSPGLALTFAALRSSKISFYSQQTLSGWLGVSVRQVCENLRLLEDEKKLIKRKARGARAIKEKPHGGRTSDQHFPAWEFFGKVLVSDPAKPLISELPRIRADGTFTWDIFQRWKLPSVWIPGPIAADRKIRAPKKLTWGILWNFSTKQDDQSRLFYGGSSLVRRYWPTKWSHLVWRHIQGLESRGYLSIEPRQGSEPRVIRIFPPAGAIEIPPAYPPLIESLHAVQ